MAVKPVFYKSPHNYDLDAESDAAALQPHEIGESLTVQSHALDTDLNEMMRRFGITGKMPENFRIPSYGDYLGITDFRGAMDAMLAAQENFMMLPGEVRARFLNDPQMFLDFCDDPRNIPELRKMGLMKPEVLRGESGEGGEGAAGARVEGGAGRSRRESGEGVSRRSDDVGRRQRGSERVERGSARGGERVDETER